MPDTGISNPDFSTHVGLVFLAEHYPLKALGIHFREVKRKRNKLPTFLFYQLIPLKENKSGKAFRI